jgi:hypothetical protein
MVFLESTPIFQIHSEIPNKILQIRFTWKESQYLAKWKKQDSFLDWYSLYRYYEDEGWYYAVYYDVYGCNWKICEDPNTPFDKSAKPVLDLAQLLRDFNLNLDVRALRR